MTLEESLQIEKQTMNENDVMLIRLPFGAFPIDQLAHVTERIQEYMGKFKVILVPTQYEEEIIDKDVVKQFLLNQIEKLQ